MMYILVVVIILSLLGGIIGTNRGYWGESRYGLGIFWLVLVVALIVLLYRGF